MARKLTQSKAIIIAALITVLLGGLISGYFRIREVYIPIEATLTAETLVIVGSWADVETQDYFSVLGKNEFSTEFKDFIDLFHESPLVVEYEDRTTYTLIEYGLEFIF